MSTLKHKFPRGGRCVARRGRTFAQQSQRRQIRYRIKTERYKFLAYLQTML